MQDSVKELLKKNYHYWEAVNLDRSFYRMDGQVINDIEEAVRLHTGTKPNTQRWCGDCIIKLFESIYPQYDKIIK